MEELLDRISHPDDYRVRSYPENVQDELKPIYDSYLDDEVPTIEIRDLGRTCYTFEGVYYKNLKRIIEGSPYYFERTHPEALGIYRETPVQKLKRLTKHLLFTKSYKQQEGLLATDYYSYSYYHWFSEALPRIYYARLNRVGGKIFLPSICSRYAYIAESLRMFPEMDMEYVPHGSKVFIKNTKWVSPAGKPYQFNTPLMRAYREQIWAHYGAKTTSSKKSRIFVNRKKATKRKLINEEEVLDIFKKHGFAIIDFEDYPWNEQVKLCYDTSIIAGIHGAGLTNMLFCPEDVVVFELQKKMHFASCFFRLSNAIGARYITQYSVEDFDTSESEVLSDVKIDIDELRKNLEFIE